MIEFNGKTPRDNVRNVIRSREFSFIFFIAFHTAIGASFVSFNSVRVNRFRYHVDTMTTMPTAFA